MVLAFQGMNDFHRLKTKHRVKREGFSQDLSVRLHRSLSWLDRAEQAQSDADASFIFHWIAFNAAYAGNALEEEGYSEISTFYQFFEKIIKNDPDRQIYNLIWDRFSQEIKGILSNKYIFSSYWRHSGEEEESAWEKSFQASIKKSNHALAAQDTCTILSILFSRIYVLRNQIFHGNATWNGAVNRSQVNDCEKLLSALVPCMLDIMMDAPDEIWGALAYPVQPN